MPITTKIANITRGSLHDGKGIRTVVYFKGCNLHCKWCHNPECISFKPQILYAPNKCIQCGICVELCNEHHLIDKDKHVYIKDGCVGCGRCASSCPVNSLELCGVYILPQDLLKEILKDKPYYDTSSGGVTFSGGECLLHTSYLQDICRMCKDEGISITIESALNVPWENINLILPYVDDFYIDIKHMDDSIHRYFTGGSNTKVLENLKGLARVHESILVRTPLIPGVNDSFDNLLSTALFALNCGVKGVELLRYNFLGKSKYSLLQDDYVSFLETSQSKEYMDELCKQLSSRVNREGFVFWVE